MSSTLDVIKLTEGNDVLLNINKVGTGQFSKLRDFLYDNNIISEFFTFTKGYEEEFKKHAELIANKGKKLAILDFDIELDKNTNEDIKKTIEIAKDFGIQVIVVIKTPTEELNVSKEKDISNKILKKLMDEGLFTNNWFSILDSSRSYDCSLILTNKEYLLEDINDCEYLENKKKKTHSGFNQSNIQEKKRKLK